LKSEGKTPNVPMHMLRERNHLLILVMDFIAIAFRQLWDEKCIVTAEVYKMFLETYVGIRLKLKGCKCSGILYYNDNPKKIYFVTKFLVKNSFEI
jgi:hypothetical protein